MHCWNDRWGWRWNLRERVDSGVILVRFLFQSLLLYSSATSIMVEGDISRSSLKHYKQVWYGHKKEVFARRCSAQGRVWMGNLQGRHQVPPWQDPRRLVRGIKDPEDPDWVCVNGDQDKARGAEVLSFLLFTTLTPLEASGSQDESTSIITKTCVINKAKQHHRWKKLTSHKVWFGHLFFYEISLYSTKRLPSWPSPATHDDRSVFWRFMWQIWSIVGWYDCFAVSRLHSGKTSTMLQSWPWSQNDSEFWITSRIRKNFTILLTRRLEDTVTRQDSLIRHRTHFLDWACNF